MKITILGAGNFGSALAFVWSESGHSVALWSVEKKVVDEIQKKRTNKLYLKNLKFSQKVTATDDIAQAVNGAQIIVFAVPSNIVKTLAQQIAKIIPKNSYVINTAKGFDPETRELLPNAIASVFPKARSKKIFQLSGPAFANDLAIGDPTAMDIAGNLAGAKELAKTLSTKKLFLMPTSDIIGTAFGGSAKNAYAIAMGMCDAAGFGTNAIAIIINSAICEMSELCEQIGGQRKTIAGLSGLGDLVATGLCETSRNRIFGRELVLARSPMSAHRRAHATTEGIASSEILYRLSRKHKLNMPLAKMIYNCVHLYKDPKKELEKFFITVGR
ncbi:MAG: hypothetical protein ACD_15C00194G0002 [uncultured bacterium]|nr:MAG: hypothetical protein ACD_15C00194G0002 [uncultured bacterium]HBD05488.1 hypothetical protein [Candidatus Uhrbacteria bacterium]